MNSDDERRLRFEVLAADVYEPLQRYLYRRARPDDVADVLSDTLLVVWRRLDDVPPDALPWCFGVARRCLANRRRSADRQLKLVQRTATFTRETAGGDPQDEVERRDPDLHAALQTLTDSEAEILRLWAWERMEPRDIAVVLELTPNAVSVALTRGKRKLADRLGRQNHDDAGHFRSAGSDERREMPDE